MADTATIVPDPEVEGEYASSEDSDFAPEDAAARESSPDDSDDEGVSSDTASATVPKRKRDANNEEAQDIGFENSGDEAIIEKAKTKRQKKARKADQDVNEGGDGGLIKTRSQRAQEKAERKATAVSGPVTVDVDALWAQMNNPTAAVQVSSQADATTEAGAAAGATVHAGDADKTTTTEGTTQAPQMIKIKRTYNFAGKVHTEEKLVSRDSAEAKLYLESLGEGAVLEAAEENGDQPRRRPKKAFRSAFEPISDQLASRRDLNLGIAARMEARDLAKDVGAKKLTTVEKSRMDWAGYVDKEGIQDELKLAGKSKHSYAERQGFLARSEARREDDARKARMATRV
ncbi:uncharacterized protein PpBr36_05972 [Pyricularia pennisetigena]|uniref:uncharacterized protein n=1 Tax=Pyricularia pennisetigena TaxID=1578925 RepID=UPI00114EA26D|nr:uncharacterized protein PpBr36_05972 [Pyricularia pennisetigena]TLS23395.1 hypothetical protein PpBr36_05972 [Pyricularia pennisetigena]